MWFSDLGRMPGLRDIAAELATRTLTWICGLFSSPLVRVPVTVVAGGVRR
jgi:hypothetical protein